MENKQFNILKGLGIIFVVLGHTIQVFTWYPVYSFHMALFFFISGYFYNAEYENKIGILFRKRINSLLKPYFLYKLFYALIYFSLMKMGILGRVVGFSLESFVLDPFKEGGEYPFFMAGWFICTLFVVQMVFVFLYKNMKKITRNVFFHVLVCCGLAVLGTYLGNHGFTQGWKITITKVLFGIFFFYFGVLYNEKLEKKISFKSAYLFISFALQICMISVFKDINYVLGNSNFGGHIFLPIVASLNGIYFYLFVSKALAGCFPNNDWLVMIGKNSLHILANHLLVFFLLSFVFVEFYGIKTDVLNDVWYKYNVDNFWLVYASAGVFLPVICVRLLKWLNRIYKQKQALEQ